MHLFQLERLVIAAVEVNTGIVPRSFAAIRYPEAPIESHRDEGKGYDQFEA